MSVEQWWKHVFFWGGFECFLCQNQPQDDSWFMLAWWVLWMLLSWHWMFPKIVVPQNGWFIIENPIKMGDLGVPLFSETPNCFSRICWISVHCFFRQGPASWELLTSYTCRLILKPMRPEPSHIHMSVTSQDFLAARFFSVSNLESNVTVVGCCVCVIFVLKNKHLAILLVTFFLGWLYKWPEIKGCEGDLQPTRG